MNDIINIGLNNFPQNPHWFVNILIGSFIGILLPYFFKSFLFLFRFFQKEYLTGKWHGYYFITEGGTVSFYSDDNFIKSGFLHKLVITAKRHNENSNQISRYKGYIAKEGGYFGNYMLVQLTKVETGEKIFYRYVYPQPHSNYTIGLWLALDYDGIVTVGTKVLSRNELSENDVKQLIQKVKLNNSFKTLRLLHMLETNANEES